MTALSVNLNAECVETSMTDDTFLLLLYNSLKDTTNIDSLIKLLRF